MKQILTALSVLLLFSALKMAPKETPGSTPYSRRKIPPPPAKPCKPGVVATFYANGKLLATEPVSAGFILTNHANSSGYITLSTGKTIKPDKIEYTAVNQ